MKVTDPICYGGQPQCTNTGPTRAINDPVMPGAWHHSHYWYDSSWNVGWLVSPQHASVSQGRICSEKCTCCHTEIEAADQTSYFTQSQHTDTWATSPRADSVTPDAWEGNHCSASFLSHWYDSRLGKKSPRLKRESNPGSGVGIAQLVVFGLAVHCVAGSILLWGHFPVEGIFPLELTWVQTPFPKKTPSDESINRGLVCAHMHLLARTQKILTFMS